MAEKARIPVATKFGPFQRYLENRDLITKHLNATQVAFGIAVCLLGDTRVRAASEKRVLAISKKADSYTQADFGIDKIERSYGWVTFEEFATLENRAIDQIKNDAEAGLLGRIEKHPKNGSPIIFWPQEKKETKEGKR